MDAYTFSRIIWSLALFTCSCAFLASMISGYRMWRDGGERRRTLSVFAMGFLMLGGVFDGLAYLF